MLIVAHRGGGGLRIENTLAAFQNAIDLGADGAELDVRLSADGEVIVHHNDRLHPGYSRHPDGGWVEQPPLLGRLPLEALRQYEIGAPRPDSPYAAKFDLVQPVPGQKIPLLREVIQLVRNASMDFFLVVEIKAAILEAASAPWQLLVDKTLAIIEEEAFGDRFVLCSFDWGALVYAMTKRPGTRTWFTSHPFSWYVDESLSLDLRPGATYLQKLRKRHRKGNAPWYGGYDPRNYRDGHAEAVAAAGGDAWFMYHRDYTADAAEALVRQEIVGAAWSIDLRDEDAIAQPGRLGAMAICLDYPDLGLRLSRPPR